MTVTCSTAAELAAVIWYRIVNYSRRPTAVRHIRSFGHTHRGFEMPCVVSKKKLPSATGCNEGTLWRHCLPRLFLLLRWKPLDVTEIRARLAEQPSCRERWWRKGSGTNRAMQHRHHLLNLPSGWHRHRTDTDGMKR
jgi:hypothetical protein